MRRLCTSDWQLDSGERDRYRTDFVVNDLPKLIDKYKVDQLLVLGDVCEKKDNHPAPLVNEIVDAFYNLQKQCAVIVLEGNHDFLHKEHPYFKFISKFDNVTWISTPTELDNCLYLPHTRDYKQDWKSIGFTKEYDYVFAHNIFTGVSTSTGHALSGIPHNIFPKDVVVISGDVHEPQTINENIIYVGSPTITDFGDDYQPRVLLLDDLQIKSIKVYGQQKRLIKVDWDGEKSIFHHSEYLRENDLVKMQVFIQMDHVSEWATIRQSVEQWATKRNFVVVSIIPQVAYVKGERQKLVNSSKKSDTEYLKTFVSRSGADEKTAEVGQQIIELV